jgi:hypothetical protein
VKLETWQAIAKWTQKRHKNLMTRDFFVLFVPFWGNSEQPGYSRRLQDVRPFLHARMVRPTNFTNP